MEIAKRIGLSSWRRGALYVNLYRLEDAGLIESSSLPDGRREYWMTLLGQQKLEQETPALATAVVKRDNWLVRLGKRVWRIW